MSSTICRLHAVSSSTPSQAVLITRALMQEWGCQQGQSIKVSAGNKTLIARIIGVKRNESSIFLPREIARQLSIPHFGEVRASYAQRELRLGPVIAILTTGFTGSPSAPFGERSSLFRSFLTAAQEVKPFFYVFTPGMVDWRNRVVSGWFYRKDPTGTWRWQCHTAPLPDVVYERVPNRKAESLPQVQECQTRLKSMTRCKIFNQGFFNKWSIHEKLFTHELVSENIPESHHSPDAAIIRDMVERHYMVYLKPSGGSLGLGIFRITRDPGNGYFCRFRDGEKNVLRRFRSIESLLRHHFGHDAAGLRRYLVQQGIRLVKFDERPVDFRVHMHKDKTGRWKAIGIGAKVAGAGSVTTHGRTGGSVLPMSELLRRSFPGREQEMENKIIDVSIRIATALESEVDGPLGELGLDIGLDRNRRAWLFEVNSKPGRHIFHHPTLQDAGRLSARCITEYSLKLAQFL